MNGHGSLNTKCKLSSVCTAGQPTLNTKFSSRLYVRLTCAGPLVLYFVVCYHLGKVNYS